MGERSGKILFWKMSGSGNDFILIDNRSGIVSIDGIGPLVRKVCARGLSVGADGLILIGPSQKADFAWRYYNADGGEAEMCGNGSRCAARFAYLTGIAPSPSMRFETAAGIIEAEVHEERARVKLTEPAGLRLGLKIRVEGKEFEGHFLNTGVPHLVIPVDSVEGLDVVELGRAARYHPQFSPKGTNVNFVAVQDPKAVRIRTYERGVEGETLACGTGAVAAALVLGALDRTASPVSMQTRGGILLNVDFAWDGQRFSNVHLEGDARVVFVGEMWAEAWE